MGLRSWGRETEEGSDKGNQKYSRPRRIDKPLILHRTGLETIKQSGDLSARESSRKTPWRGHGAFKWLCVPCCGENAG